MSQVLCSSSARSGLSVKFSSLDGLGLTLGPRSSGFGGWDGSHGLNTLLRQYFGPVTGRPVGLEEDIFGPSQVSIDSSSVLYFAVYIPYCISKNYVNYGRYLYSQVP